MGRTIAIVTSVVVLATGAVLYVAIWGVSSTEVLGPGWQIERREYVAGSHRGSPSRLVHTADGRREIVEEYISNAHYYPEGCVVYVTLKTTDKEFFAVCDEREPVLLATESEEDWLLTPDGMQKLAWVTEDGKLVMRPTIRMDIRDIKARALSQPHHRTRGARQ